MVVDNVELFSYSFAPRIDQYGISHGLNEGMVGLGSDNAIARIDNLKVQILPPKITLQETETFDDGTADRFTLGDIGDWQIAGGRYDGVLLAGDAYAASGMDIPVGANYLLRLQTTFNTTTSAGLFFDQYSTEDFKFVTLSAATDQILVGHYTARSGWKIDASLDKVLNAGQDYELEVTLKGTTVSIVLDGQTVLGHVFNGLVVDGNYGLYVRDGAGSFDDVTVVTNDPAYIGSPTNAAPEATDNAVGTSMDTPLVIDAAFLLANDMDPEGDPLTIDSFTQPGHGTLVDNGDATYTYTPASGFLGDDSFIYTITDGNGGFGSAVVHITVIAGSTSGTDTFSASPNLALPDLATMTTTITISGAAGATITDLNVMITISHSRTADLDVFLISPSGTRVELFTDIGVGADFIGTTLDDEAGSPITGGINPYSGVYRPEGLLSDFDGENMNGTWTLEITDDQKKQTGTIESWALIIEHVDDGQLLTAAAAPAAVSSGPLLSEDALASIIDEAIARWMASGLVEESAFAALDTVTFEIADLSGLVLGDTLGDTIMIDSDAAGYGWFIDVTVSDDEEFVLDSSDNILVAIEDSAADGRMDLLTAVMHEIGHLLGLEHSTGDIPVMNETLQAGTRLSASTGTESLLTAAELPSSHAPILAMPDYPSLLGSPYLFTDSHLLIDDANIRSVNANKRHWTSDLSI